MYSSSDRAPLSEDTTLCNIVKSFHVWKCSGYNGVLQGLILGPKLSSVYMNTSNLINTSYLKNDSF